MDDFEYAEDVGWHSEANRENVTSVVIEEGVTSVSKNAFQDFRNVTSMQIPEGVTSIAYDAFYYCSSVSSIKLPATLTEIDAGAFFGCSGLEKVLVSEGNERYRSDEAGALYDTVSKTLIQYPLGASNTYVYAVSPGTLAIGDGAFAYDEWEDRCTVQGAEDGYLRSLPDLKHVVIPSSVKVIDWGAFDKAWFDTVTVLSDDAEFNDPVGNFMNNNPVVRCTANSTAESWAHEEGFETEIIDVPDFQVSGVAESYSYTGNEICPDVEVSKGGKILRRYDGEYGQLFDGNVVGPVATMLIYGKGDYAGFATERTYIVNGAPSAIDSEDIANAEVSIAQQVFTGEPLNPSVVVKLGDKILEVGSDYTIQSDGAVNAGTYEVTVEGQGVYSGQAKGMFQIAPKPVTVYARNVSKTFGATDPQLKASVTGLVGKDTIEYSLSRKTGENVGSYATTAMGSARQGSCSVSFRDATFFIAAASIKGRALMLSSDSFTYAGKCRNRA